MNTPIPPTPPTPLNPMTPSNSVLIGAAVGTPVVIIISWILDQFFKVQVPPEVAAAGGTIIGSLLAYFGNGGRAVHTA